MPLGSEFVEVIIVELGGAARKVFIDTTEFAAVEGIQGPEGEQGETGDPGPPGSAGQDGGLSFYRLDAGQTLTIPDGRQHLVQGPFINNGTLIVNGQQVIL